MKISTVLQATNAKPGVHKVTGAVGLYLKGGESGSASWFFRYRLGDKRREAGLGSRDNVSLAEARDAARAFAVKQKEGVDPIDERRRVRAENIARGRNEGQGAITFKAMTELFIKAHAGEWKHHRAKVTWLGPLARYAFPVIAETKLDQIEPSHVLTIIEACKAAGAKETAKRVQSYIKRVLDYARAKGLRSATLANPADRSLLAQPKRKGERPHFRAPEVEGAPEIFQQLWARMEGSSAFAAWTWMILTASRPSEALNARWSEIDLERKLWVVPAARMKSAKPHAVPLSPAALAVLERQRSVRTGDAVFPGRGGSPLGYNTFATAPQRTGIDAATPHGWRSCFRDWCGDIGDVPRDLAESALAHSLGSVEASYRRRTAVERRRDVMERYSKWLCGEGAAKVLAFPRAERRA